ncbi:MAG: tetratricopeptide repeat protein [Prevotellaceae bacterium]|nr:tetratricopeptide repeat protein [Prevotellaceae bacterium]
MRKKYLHTLLVVVGLLTVFGGCSTKKNTAMTRAYHSFTTGYNVRFNGKESFKEGVVLMQKANQDDYSTYLPMYPISNKGTAQAATSQMDKTIEKSRKAIKTHSIKVKPKRKIAKMNDPKYSAFYNQQEFNSALKEAWLLLGQAEFNKADFLGSVGTFSYISKHYPENKDVSVQCQIWTARAFLEMGWTYEAEELLAKVNQDDLKRSRVGLFVAANAQLLLAQKQYDKAIPFLEKALEKEKNKYQKARFSYILGQLYKNKGDMAKARTYFSKVVRMHPPYEMNFYARINRIDLAPNNSKKAHKQIKSLIKNPNNKQYLDQLFYLNGNVFIAEKDTVKALEQYKLAADSSSRNGMDKAQALLAAGKIYYEQKKYLKAEPCYSAAATIVSVDNPDYQSINKKATVLAELAVQAEIVNTQDSLLQLADLPPEQQLEIINQTIKAKQEADKEAERQLARAERAAANSAYNPFGGDNGGAASQSRSARPTPNLNPNVGGATGEWYFYNVNLVKNGKQEFTRKWGNRQLSDNWRRMSKAATVFADKTETSENVAIPEGENEGDSGSIINNDKPSGKEKTDVKDEENPEFYLAQLPATAEAKATANAQVATAMFNMGIILKDKLEDIQSATYTFAEFERRFGTDERVPDAYFQQYVMQVKIENAPEAERYRQIILTEYPNSKYAKMLATPDFVAMQLKMLAEQDSLYNETYTAYAQNNFAKIFENTAYMQQHFPQSDLMPKFLFLDALSKGKTEPSDTFAIALNSLIAQYPQSDVTAMAKDILALMMQGRENQIGTGQSSLIALREENLRSENDAVSNEAAQKFSTDKLGKHRLMINARADKSQMNELMYQVAVYNFSRFMIKDFDLITTRIDSTHTMLSITNLETFDEAKWYEKSLGDDPTLAAIFAKLDAQTIVISEENFALLQAGISLDKYLAFENAIETAKPTAAEIKKADKMLKPAEPETVEIKVVEIPKPDAEPTTLPTENQPASENAATPEMWKNTFAIEPAAPHFIALYVMNGKIDFEKVRTAFDNYNATNYAPLNLKLTLEKAGKNDVILISSFANADVAKSYLLRMVQEKTISDATKGSSYRNLMGTQRNLNTATTGDSNTLTSYMEFMKEIYLK